MNSWQAGLLLRVDLCTGVCNASGLDTSVLAEFLGGQGLAVKLLFDELQAGDDPMGPDNVIVICPGLLTGTMAPASARTEIVTKSPVTGGLGRGNFGGYWGARFRLAGFSALVLVGRSSNPVNLIIDGREVRLADAEPLWGTDAWETTTCLREQLGPDFSVLCIGPAGENQVKFACPVIDFYNAAGRSHAGCVMGSKLLKAIAVRGDQTPVAIDPLGYARACEQAMDRVIRHPNWGCSTRPRIDNMLVTRAAAVSGRLACRNFQTTKLSEESEVWKVPDIVEPSLRSGPDLCYQCRVGRGIGCNLIAEIKAAEGTELLHIGPANYLLTVWMPQAGIQSYEGTWRMRELCQRLGMDQLTPIPQVMEWYERGILTERNTGGLKLSWGNEEAIREMLRRIAFRIGIGDWLANGIEFCAKQLGQDAENVLMALKGSPILSSDPRSGSLSEALGILVNPRGGDDLNTTHTLVDSFPEWARLRGWSRDEFLRWWRDWLDMPPKLKRTLFGDPPRSTALDNRDPEGKPDLVCWYSKLVALYDSLGLCMFPVNLLGAWGPTHMANLCSSYLGIDYSPEDVMHIGERVATLMKSFSVKHSCRDGREAWPDRFYNEPLPEGPMKGQRLSRIVMEDLTKTYYALMGWDYQTGKPHIETLVRLGLQDIADDIW